MAANDSAARAYGLSEPIRACPVAVMSELPSFEQIYERYFELVWSSARRLGIGDAAMDDVVQEIFIVIHSKVHTLQKPPSLRSWIYGIVRRTVSDHHRARRTREASGVSLAVHHELEQSLPRTPLDLTEQNDQVRLLWGLLAELDLAKREVFMLVELQEMTVPEVADALEIPLNTAYSRLRAARQAFDASLARRVPREEERGAPCRN
jgi:RNA polymerase sigma-70 factor (ECF subfamily)